MIKTDPKLISHLENNALWFVMHPVLTFDNEIHEIYPWLRADTINFSRKIAYYLKPIVHKAICAPSQQIRFFNDYKNIVTHSDLDSYLKQNKLEFIVYCGFHYGFCIINDENVGMKRMTNNYRCYVKHDLCQILWEADWGERDKITSRYGTII